MSTPEGDFIGSQQLAYLSYPESGKDKFLDAYIFDKSAGSDFPVYIVDSGAQLAHDVRSPKQSVGP